MEPFSAAAATLTVIEAVSKASKSVSKAVNIAKNAPDILLALNNEVQDVRLLANDV